MSVKYVTSAANETFSRDNVARTSRHCLAMTLKAGIIISFIHHPPQHSSVHPFGQRGDRGGEPVARGSSLDCTPAQSRRYESSACPKLVECTEPCSWAECTREKVSSVESATTCACHKRLGLINMAGTVLRAKRTYAHKHTQPHNHTHTHTHTTAHNHTHTHLSGPV